MKAFLSRAFNAGSLLAVAVVSAGFIGYTSNPADQAEARYNLVEIHRNGESDIRDHGLTAEDCRAALLRMAFDHAGRFTCEFDK